jgi:hypothetical protein
MRVVVGITVVGHWIYIEFPGRRCRSTCAVSGCAMHGDVSSRDLDRGGSDASQGETR